MIKEAFDVTLEDGVSIHQTEVLDNYGSDESCPRRDQGCTS